MNYAVTINSNRIEKDCEPGSASCRVEYVHHVAAIRQLGKVQRLVYEIGKQGRCHLHATIKSDRTLTQEEIHSALYKEGFYYDCKPVRSFGAWNTYIGKDQPKSIQKTCMINVRLV